MVCTSGYTDSDFRRTSLIVHALDSHHVPADRNRSNTGVTGLCGNCAVAGTGNDDCFAFC